MAQIILEDLPFEERQRWVEERREEAAKTKLLEQFPVGHVFKYKLTVEGNSHVQSVMSNFAITSLHELTYLDHDDETDLYRFSLRELSYKLDKYEDPVVAQIIEMSNMVSEIYKELDFGVDRYGNIHKIYNRSQINKKWGKTKEYLTYKYPLSSYEIIKTKEKELANPNMELNNIGFMHFLQVYFKPFGRFEDYQKFETIHMDQFGSGIPFGLSITIRKEPDKGGKIHRKMEGNMMYDRAVIDMLQKTVKDNEAEVSYTTRADYYSDGAIIEEANFSYQEKIGEGYDMYSYLHLELIKDEQ